MTELLLFQNMVPLLNHCLRSKFRQLLTNGLRPGLKFNVKLVTTDRTRGDSINDKHLRVILHQGTKLSEPVVAQVRVALISMSQEVG